MTVRQCIQFILWIGLLALLTASALAADRTGAGTQANIEAQRLFDKGQQAFEKKNYEQALSYFVDAYDHGLRTGQLFYNLGTANFQLGNYYDAEAAFRRAASDAALTDISYYNLALIAIKQQDADKAGMWLRRTLQVSYNPRIRQLAQTLLTRLDKKVQEIHAQRAWKGLLSVTGGYDDNVTLLSDAEAVTNSGQEDSSLETFVHAEAPLFGSSFNFELNAYLQRYKQLSSYDLNFGSIALSHSSRGDRWDQHESLESAITQLDHQDFNRINTLSWTGRRRLSAERLYDLSYSVAQITSLDPAYEYLDGWRHRARAQYQRSFDRIWMKLGYTLEYNDRKDLKGTYFTSYSSTSHALGLELNRQLSSKLDVGVTAEIRDSLYHDPNTYSGNISIKREDTRKTASINLNYELGSKSELSLEVSKTENVANISTYGYNRTQAQLSLLVSW